MEMAKPEDEIEEESEEGKVVEREI